jgi:hypothetical protein
MTEQEIIALKFYVQSLKDSITKLRQLRGRPNRKVRIELLGSQQAMMDEQMMRHMEMDLQGNVDIVYAIRMELLMQKYRDSLGEHGIEFVELPLAFEEMTLDDEGESVARSYEETPPNTDLN